MKKGQLDIGKLFVFMAVVFVFVIIIAVIILWINTLQSALLPVAEGIIDADGTNTTSVQIYTDTIGQLSAIESTMSWAVIAIIITLLLSIPISCLLARNHPAVIVPYIFIVIVAVIFSVLISKEYGVIMNDPVLSSTLTGFLGVTWFFGNLPIIIAVVGLIGGGLLIMNMNKGEMY
jgi:ABC-type spermidine/putrescine transport system permease subunit I